MYIARASVQEITRLPIKVPSNGLQNKDEIVGKLWTHFSIQANSVHKEHL